jgi:hypothetical protein
MKRRTTEIPMSRFLSPMLLLITSLFVTSLSCYAQNTNNPFPIPRDQENRKEDLPSGIKENLARQRLKQQEKEFAQLLQRAEEAAKIAGELNASYEQNNALKSSDHKKLQRLEKLVKKIREELGGSDDGDEEENERLSTGNALRELQEKTSVIFSKVKEAGRYAVSVTAIESSNFVLRTIRFLRLAP